VRKLLVPPFALLLLCLLAGNLHAQGPGNATQARAASAGVEDAQNARLASLEKQVADAPKCRQLLDAHRWSRGAFDSGSFARGATRQNYKTNSAKSSIFRKLTPKSLLAMPFVSGEVEIGDSRPNRVSPAAVTERPKDAGHFAPFLRPSPRRARVNARRYIHGNVRFFLSLATGLG
jgi:hypothetical protein